LRQASFTAYRFAATWLISTVPAAFDGRSLDRPVNFIQNGLPVLFIYQPTPQFLSELLNANLHDPHQMKHTGGAPAHRIAISRLNHVELNGWELRVHDCPNISFWS